MPLNQLSNAMPLSKSKIVQQFDRAATHYDRFAGVQRNISDDLVTAVDTFASARKDTIAIADFGCGTGTLIKSLADLGYQNLFGFDIAPLMLVEAKQKCPPEVSFACSDIESLPVADNSFDVIASNAALQWCRSENAFAEIERTLRAGGQAFVCTFGPQTLKQWQDAFGSHVHTFETSDQIADSIASAGLKLLKLETRLVDVEFTSVKAMFDSVRRIGASNAQQNPNKSHISKSDYRAAKSDFEETLKTEGKLALTYEVINIAVEKE